MLHLIQQIQHLTLFLYVASYAYTHATSSTGSHTPIDPHTVQYNTIYYLMHMKEIIYDFCILIVIFNVSNKQLSGINTQIYLS